jgi:hypothetical protein
LSALRLLGFSTEPEFVVNGSIISSKDSNDIELEEDCDIELGMACEEIDNSNGDTETELQFAFLRQKINLPCPVHTLRMLGK